VRPCTRTTSAKPSTQWTESPTDGVRSGETSHPAISIELTLRVSNFTLALLLFCTDVQGMRALTLALGGTCRSIFTHRRIAEARQQGKQSAPDQGYGASS
jgi:hypothetical protein